MRVSQAKINPMVKKRSFEESLNRLGEIVDSLEHNSTGLAEAMKLYDEGTEIVLSCRTELESAEMRVTELRARLEGGFSEEPLEI